MGRFQAYHYIKKWGLKCDETLNSSIYECTNCKACEQICPSSIEICNVTNQIRTEIVEEGFVPKTIRDALNNTFKHGNPWGHSKKDRTKWAEGLKVTKLFGNQEADLLYFVGCAPSYDPRCQMIAKSLVAIYDYAKIDCAILGDEMCCGNCILRMGERGLFDILAEENLKNLKKRGVQRVITSSPHCYNAFVRDYPSYGGKFEVLHYTQFISELLDQGKLKFSREVEKVVAYHDPCFLGRHNDIYEAPRKILEAIPGLTVIEMKRTREDSFCCGGGGGRMWMEDSFEKRPSIIRAEDATSTDPEVLVTACPFCLVQLEDAIKSMDKEEEIEVKDLAEIVKEAI